MMSTGSPGVLDYSTPRCFFEREYRHRSWTGAVGAAVLLGFAVFAASMGRWIPASPGWPMKVGQVALLAVAAACAAGAAWVLFNFLRNTVDVVRITEEGIEQNRRLYPWSRVTGLGGAAVVGGVMLEFQTPAPAALPAELPHSLKTSPMLKREEFEALLGALAEYLAEDHPHVTLNPVPRTADWS